MFNVKLNCNDTSVSEEIATAFGLAMTGKFGGLLRHFGRAGIDTLRKGLATPLKICINVLVICFGITYTILINRK